MRYVRRNGVWINPVQGQARKSVVTQTAISNIYRRQGGTWVLAWESYTYTPMSAKANNVNDVHPRQTGTFIVGTSTCTVTGGNSPKTYAWTKVSGDDFILSAPNAATTNFSHLATIAAGFIATYRCTVSDGTGSTYVNIQVEYEVGQA